MSRPFTPGEAAAQITEIGKLLYQKSLIVATEGNLSVRLGPDRFLVTASGVCKGRLRSVDLVTVTGEGRRVAGGGEPSSEIPMHLAVYRVRPDVRAMVHAHPPTATGFSVAGLPLDERVLPEVLLGVGPVPLTPYGTPSTADLCEAVLPAAREHDAFLLKNHGAVTLGNVDLWQAFHRMEMVENLAKITLTARLLGCVEPLEDEEISKLLRLHAANPPAVSHALTPDEEELVNKVLERLGRS